MLVERLESMSAVPAAEWDAVVGPGCAFFEHAFLKCMEDAGCVGPETGWPTERVRTETPTSGRGKLRPPPARAPQNPEPTGLRVLSRSAENAHRVEYLLE